MDRVTALKKGLLPGKPHLPRWCLGALALILLTAAASPPWVHQLLVDIPYHKAIQSTLEGRAKAYSQLVDRYMANHIQAMNSLANSPQAIEVLHSSSEASTTARTLWEIQAREQLTDARQIFLLHARDEAFPLKGNYIAENLYEAALTGKAPPPRAAKIKDWAIYTARPVLDQGQVVGAVVAEVTLPSLHKLLLGASDGLDQVSLIQHVDQHRSGVLISLGSAPAPQAEVIQPTAIPDWRIRLRGTPTLIATIQRTHISYGLLAALIWGVALLLCAFLIRTNLTFVNLQKEVKTSRFDPRDDLFTEHYIKEATSYLDPIPQKKVPVARQSSSSAAEGGEFPPWVFRDYDIRGQAETDITPHFATTLGRVLGSMALESGDHTLALACDGRLSSSTLLAALGEGILSAGCDVISVGLVPTPLLNFALHSLTETSSGVMITASHNPAADNGFKIIFNNHVLSSNEILKLHKRMEEKSWFNGEGQLDEKPIIDSYSAALLKDILPASGLKVVLDCANGAASLIAPELLRRLGCEVIELYCTVDGNFPNHPPDPTVVANLDTLVATVVAEQADLGFAFDGDGDRLVAVTGSGRIVWPDELLMIFVRDVLTRSPGADVVFDVKCSRRLHNLIINHGGRPVMWKTGHAHMRNKMAESGAPVGGEFSGHLFFNDRWFGFDDGLYAAARLLEIIALREQSLDEIVATFPVMIATPEIKIAVRDQEKFTYVDALRLAGNFGDGTLITIDGVRVEFRDGWGLIRASNTSPALTLRFEADSEAALKRIQGVFREQLLKLDNDLPLTF